MNLNLPGIYAIINNKSGKVYIGSTIRSFRARWLQHRKRLIRDCHKNSHLQRAWNKYGEDAFEFIILEYINNPETLINREQYWLDKIRSTTKVYNVGMLAANAMFGRKHTEETKQKISSRLKGIPHTAEHKRRISEGGKGKKRTKETRQRISEGRKGIEFTDEHKHKISIAKGKPYPAFIHIETGEIIPAGVNLRSLCRARCFDPSSMCRVVYEKQKQHKGWILK